MLTTFSKKQFTSYLHKQNIRKNDKFSPSGSISPWSPPAPSDSQSPGSNCEGKNSLNPPRDAVLLDEPIFDFDQDAVPPRSNRTVRRVGLLPESMSTQQFRPFSYDVPLDEHVLTAICGAEDGACQREDDSALIRRTADVALFFLDPKNPQQSQQLFDRLQNMIKSRLVDLYCHDYNVLALLDLTQPAAHHSWSRHLQRLSCRVSLLIASFWKLDYDIFSRGRMLVELLANSLLYSDGRSIADDLPTRPEVSGHLDNPSHTTTFADHLRQNCFRFITARRHVTSEADWIHMLLGFQSLRSRPVSKELQIDHVANFVLPAHVDSLSTIFRWCIENLNRHGFHNVRRSLIDSYYTTINVRRVTAADDEVVVERWALRYYLLSSFWQLRGRATSALTNMSSDEIAILSGFRKLLDDFGLSEFDILQQLVELFVSPRISEDTTATAIQQKPRYLDPGFLDRLSSRFSSREDSGIREEVANWWLSCWIWNPEPSNESDFQQTVLAARLGNHILKLISQGLEATHPSNKTNARKELQTADVEVLPTLYEGIAGSRKVHLPGSGAERNSYNMTSSPNLSKSQHQRSSGGSSDYANFVKCGRGPGMSPSKRSPTLPSEGFQDRYDDASNISKRWGFSISSRGTSGSKGTRSSGHRSISGLGIRDRVSATISRHRRNLSQESSRGDAQMQDFFNHDRRCMSPRVMTDNSLMG